MVEMKSFIVKAKKLGFSEIEIKLLLSLNQNSNANCAKIAKRTVKKLRAVKEKAKDLKKLEFALNTLLDACETSTEAKSTFKLVDCFEEKSA